MIKKILSKNNTLLDYGSCFSFDANADVDIISIIDGITFTVRVKFEDNETEEHSINKKVDIDKKIIELTCVNFKSPLGTGTTNPINLLSINDKKITLHLWVFLLGSKSTARKIDYTFFIEE